MSGAFTTRILSGMGGELTISNPQVPDAVTRNDSRTLGVLAATASADLIGEKAR